jgi:hypothetical protein
MTLALRRTVFFDGERRPNDYEVRHDGRTVGRVYRMRSTGRELWRWTQSGYSNRRTVRTAAWRTDPPFRAAWRVWPELRRHKICVSSKPPAARRILFCAIGTFLFKCPNTTHSVQGWLDEGIYEDENTYHTIECAACGQVHLVSPTTGRVLRRPGED